MGITKEEGDRQGKILSILSLSIALGGGVTF